MQLKIKIQPCNDYTNPIDCGIAKGLRKKAIFALVSPTRYYGLFLGFIPIWGRIPKESNKIAYKADEDNFKSTDAIVGLYN